MSKVLKIRLHNKAKNKSRKNKEYRMVEFNNQYVPRDCTFPLNSDIFAFDKDAATVLP